MAPADCLTCGQDLRPESGAVALTDKPHWVPFVEDLRSADAVLEHPACFVSRKGLDALLDVIEVHDRRNRLSTWELIDKLEHFRNDDRARLKYLLDAHLALKFPGFTRAGQIIGEDRAMRLIDAEGYVAGLVTSFLSSGRIRRKWINFDPVGHARALSRLQAEDAPELADYIEYTRSVTEMATTLARVSGVPLRHTT